MNRRVVVRWNELLLVVLFGVVFYLPFLGQVSLFDWDEANFAEISREMIVSGEFLQPQVGFEPFYQKPPLFFWLQSLSMMLGGIDEYFARLVNAVCGIVTLVVLYLVGSRISSTDQGMYWALLMGSSMLPFFYFKSGIIDPVFNFWMLLSLVSVFYSYREEGRWLVWSVVAGMMCGLAVLTKGPVAVVIVFGSWLLAAVLERHWRVFRPTLLRMAVALCGVVVVGGAWYVFDLVVRDGVFVREFVRYQWRLITTEDAGHGGPFFYHFLALLFGCFPASVLAVASLVVRGESSAHRMWSALMLSLLVVVLAIFSVVRTKVLHYSSMAYFAVSWLAADFIFKQVRSGSLGVPVWVRVLFVFMVCVYSLALFFAPIFYNMKQKFLHLIDEAFVREVLMQDISVDVSLSLLGVVMLVGNLVLVHSYRNQIERWVVTMCVFNAMLFLAILKLYVPLVESFTQKKLVEFYRSLPAGRVIVEPENFKSYLHYFYTRMEPDTRQKAIYLVHVYKRKHKVLPPEVLSSYVPLGNGYYVKVDTLLQMVVPHEELLEKSRKIMEL